MRAWIILTTATLACGAAEEVVDDDGHLPPPGDASAATTTGSDTGTSATPTTVSDSDEEATNPSSTPTTVDAETSSAPPDTTSASTGTTNATSDEDTDDPPGATCGDGIVDVEESCDDGELSATCNDDCTLADCGDGFHNPVAGEGCDDGNVVANDGCSSFCVLEDFPYRIAFVTSTVHTGDLGGLEGADVICNQLSAAAGLPGTYLAWLSDEMYSPSLRFSQSDVPYQRVDGIQIADDWADLVDGTLDFTLDMTEIEGPTPGEPECSIGGLPEVWSGTDEDGTYYPSFSNCEGWTSENGGCLRGLPHTTESTWTHSCTGGSCASEHGFYCFQQ